jgi:undecaprenyl-diphosphatase
MQYKKKNLLQFFSLKVIIINCIFLACIIGFAMIVDEVLLEHEKFFDDTVFRFFDTVTTPSLIRAMNIITLMGSTRFMLPAYVVLTCIFLLQKKFRYAIEVAVVGLTSQALLYSLKAIFHRQRPPGALIKNITTYSFPSGHTFSTFVFFSILVYIVQHTRWKAIYKWIVSVLLLLLSVTIGISRIVLKVHYPTDVSGSLLLGIAWVICTGWLINRINKKYTLNAMH